MYPPEHKLIRSLPLCCKTVAESFFQTHEVMFGTAKDEIIAEPSHLPCELSSLVVTTFCAFTNESIKTPINTRRKRVICFFIIKNYRLIHDECTKNIDKKEMNFYLSLKNNYL